MKTIKAHHDVGGSRFACARGGGFTIIELIVAIGVTVIMILGVGRLFTTTTTTISVGEATAQLNQSGRTLERLLRQDFANITRSGFLVIRNERLGESPAGDLRIRSDENNRPVFLNEEALKEWEDNQVPELTMGVRRIDQISFFALGDYSSYQFRNAYGEGFGGRGIIARNDVAAQALISYGHGLRAINLYNSSELDPASPEAEIKRQVGLNGYRAKFADEGFDRTDPLKSGVDNVNYYAADWILARQATLLMRRETADAEGAMYSSLDFTPSFIEYFNESTGYYPVLGMGANNTPFALPVYDGSDRQNYRSLRRRRSPGLVDIIDLDLSEVEKSVTDYGWTYYEKNASGISQGETGFWVDPIGRQIPEFADWSQNAQQDLDPEVYAYVTNRDDRERLGRGISENWLRGQWMRMGLATGRIRTETTPPSLSRYDQMLTQATLTPGCSQFEVAWSTGAVDFPSGRIVWYDIDQPANPYVNAIDERTENWQTTRERRERAPRDPKSWYLSEIPPAAITGTDPFNQQLWPGTGDLLENQAEDLYYATFGYFIPKTREGSKSRQGLIEREDRTEAWPWPKMIRIRVTLHDQRGLIAGGRTFEYVFDLPEPPES